jgi:ring-1,2-phenylacetyl-CoA epoxidase subunit PaaE
MTTNITLKIAEVKLETADTITIVFEKPANFDYQSGQFLTLILTINGEEVRRSYSFSSSPYTDNNPCITVKKIEGGLVSNYLFTNAYVGLSINVMPPLGLFVIHPMPNLQRDIVLIAAGSGVTPLYSMAKTILSQEPNSKVYLLLANKNENSIIFKEAFDKIHNPNFKMIHVLTKPSSAWNGATGRIDKDNIAAFITQLGVNNATNAEYYLCGPEMLMDNATAGLKQLGVSEDNIRKEKFVSATSTVAPKPTSNDANKATVIATIKNISYTFEVDANETILEAGKNAGVDLPCACENGVCTACMATCTVGVVDMNGNDTLNKNELAKGLVLTCCGYAASSNVSLMYK